MATLAVKPYHYFLPVSTGLLLWAALPGGGELWPLVFVALLPLLAAAGIAGGRSGFFLGLVAGLSHFLLQLYWIYMVLGTYGGLHWSLSSLAVLFLALYMSFFLAVFVCCAGLVLRSYPAGVSLWLLPVIWVGIDWLRAVLFTGFPWMDLGYSLFRVPELLQVADLVGHHGITCLIVFTNCFLYLLLFTRPSPGVAFRLVLFAFIIMGGAAGYSHNRFRVIEDLVQSPATVRSEIGIVQGNIDQSLKWSPDQQEQTVARYGQLTSDLVGQQENPTFVVWPETALPFYAVKAEAREPIAHMVRSQGYALLTGAPWYEIIDLESREVKYFNSAILFDTDGKIAGRYNKTHLVPFGEYVPLKRYLPFIAPLVETVGDFSSGLIKEPLHHEKIWAGVLICFESVFPELSRKWVEVGANVLVNLTNDAWYGKSSAPQQTLAMAVLRAVESRRALVRSANTGISAFISPSGEIMAQSGLFKPWVFAREVPLLEEKTYWVQKGYLFGPLCFGVGLLVSLFSIMHQKGRNERGRMRLIS